MRPLILKIKNFLSYGENTQIIDFSDYSIISFIGDNGHGKSSLLESITWALWGLARRSQGVTKSDDMIMHMGSTDMFVELTFQIKNQRYQVKRTCQKKHNRLFTGLELYLVEDREQKNLSLAHQRETQSLIESIIGIEYETFISTVYLKQGQSNEFSKKTPKERKDILCSILKINDIEKIRELILADIKTLMQERTLQVQLKERYALEQKKTILNEQEISIEILEQKRKEQEENIQRAKVYYQETKEAVTKITKLLEEKKEYSFELEKIHNTAYTAYLLHHKEFEKYQQYFFQLKTLYGQQQTEKIFDYEILSKQLRGCDQEILSLKNQESIEREIIYKQFNNTIHNIETEALFKKQTDKSIILEKKEYFLGQEAIIELLFSQYTKNNNQCFICHQTITKENTTFQKKIDFYTNKKNEITQLIISTEEKQNTLLTAYTEKKEHASKELKTALKINEEKYHLLILPLEEKKAALQRKYDSCLLSLKNQEKIALYKQEIKEIKERNLHIFLKETIISLITVKKKIKEHTLLIKDTEAKKDYLNLLFSEREKEYTLLIDAENNLKKTIQEKTQYASFLKEQLEAEQDAYQTLDKKQQEIEKILEIKSNLAHILSKDNLQAALIEEAIPIIEHEANLILEKLTEGKFKIYIDSMRDLKSGNMKETLDIKIADFLGVRYYEFFSGGESFKIDLALRIALVKLLAQKSGHAIKTFIIDEGFGSQDTHSLEKMIDVIYALQNEFDLIILISHLAGMKEQFPGQFFIQKTSAGSIVEKM